MMIRARVHGHLEPLKKRFPELLSQSDIQEFADSDYAFRSFVAKSVWSQVPEGLAEEIDDVNFKSEVASHQGKEGAAYRHSLHDVWSVMLGLQN
jgi:hypothetical protein